jgi:hypothetical protein
MSPTKMDRSLQSRSGKTFQPKAAAITSFQFAALIAAALDQDFGDVHAAVKTICKLTGAHDRAAKNWVEGKNGPDGPHLLALMSVSDAVLETVLSAVGRNDLVIAMAIADSKRELRRMLSLLHDLQNRRMKDFDLGRLSVGAVLSLFREAPMLDPADVIKTAIHSAFVKHPMEDDPDFSPSWIKPDECAHLAKVILLELEANGLQVVKKPTP